jgi:hypothetical protein
MLKLNDRTKVDTLYLYLQFAYIKSMLRECIVRSLKIFKKLAMVSSIIESIIALHKPGTLLQKIISECSVEKATVLSYSVFRVHKKNRYRYRLCQHI